MARPKKDEELKLHQRSFTCNNKMWSDLADLANKADVERTEYIRNTLSEKIREES